MNLSEGVLCASFNGSDEFCSTVIAELCGEAKQMPQEMACIFGCVGVGVGGCGVCGCVGVWVCMRVRMLTGDGGREELNLLVEESFPCIGSCTGVPELGETKS